MAFKATSSNQFFIIIKELTILLTIVISSCPSGSRSSDVGGVSAPNASVGAPSVDLLGQSSSSPPSPGHAGTIYFNNPHLLKDRRKGSSRDGGKAGGQRQSNAEEVESIGGVYIQEEAKHVSSVLRRLSNREIGVTSMQAIYDSLPFTTVVPKEEELIQDMVDRLTVTLQEYTDILQQNKEHVEELHRLHTQSEVSHVFPCCSIDENLLRFSEFHGTKVSMRHTCDLVSPFVEHNAFCPGQNLTELFGQNLSRLPTIKWQYFISAGGIHSEYPAYSFDSRSGCKLADDTRHRMVNLATMHPQRKYIVLLIDHGNSLSSTQLINAKAIGKTILTALSHHDKIGLIGLAGEPQYPRSGECLSKTMTSATYEAKFHLNRFIDGLTKAKDAANHSLGFTKAFAMIRNTFQAEGNKSGSAEALIIYVSRGLLSSLTEAKTVMETIAEENLLAGFQLVINTYAVIDDNKPIMYEKRFLQDIADQNYKQYDVSVSTDFKPKKGIMMAINSTRNLSYTIGNFYTVLSSSAHNKPVFSLPYWDSVGKGMVISITQACFGQEELIGIVGLDVHLADIVQDITYFKQNEDSYAFIIDQEGYTIMHPSFTRPLFSSEQPMHTDILNLESKSGFQMIRKDMLESLNGRETLVMSFQDNETEPKQTSHQLIKYTWQRVVRTPYIMCIVTYETQEEERALKMITVPPSANMVYHRLDLVPASKMCQHFKQLATVDASALFLSPGSFISPFEYITLDESVRNVQSYMGYLSDVTRLIANPGLKSSVRSDVTALVKITAEWKERFLNSELNKYIVRRFVVTPSGAFLMYPGALMDRIYDPTKRSWYARAMEYPGHIVITAPYLDIGGAGYIVTVSHTVYEGKPASMHSSSNAVVAVMGIDFTLGYFYKLLLEQMPVCEQDRIVCFMLDDKGYLIAHPGLIEPNGKGPVEQQHITHKEPLLANDILDHKGFVRKKVCNSFSDRTIQRFYQFNTSLEGVLTNLVHGEHCSKYQITPIPGTNLFLGIVNQTCDTATAFCPCSMVDRLCLNCHRMEQSECECPCECPLDMNLCTGAPVDTNVGNPTCLHFPEEMRLSEVQPLFLDRLEPCFEPQCSTRSTTSDCFGVMDCEWCQMDVDGKTPLKHPFCTRQRKCFGGILGARTPYADEIISLAVEDFLTVKSTPVGPVAGGIMGCFLVLVVAVYCYRHHAYRSSHECMCSVPDTTIRMSQLDNEPDDADTREEHAVGHSNMVVLASFDNPASISPYRVSTGYRRPPGGESDHGYSTMTPHEDSEYMAPYIEPLVSRDRYQPAIPHSLASTTSRASSPRPSSGIQSSISPASSINAPVKTGGVDPNVASVPPVSSLLVDLSQTVLPEPRQSHHILAAVQVHMVDTH